MSFATFLGYGFSVVAMFCSAAYAFKLPTTMGLETWPMRAVQGVLVALSCLAVLSERGLINWARSSKENKDASGARMARTLLTIAVIYTGLMQLGFFADLMLRPVSQDAAAASSIVDFDKRIRDLEEQRSWQPKSPGTPDALKDQIRSLEADKKSAEQSKDAKTRRDLVTKASDELAVARKNLVIAQTIEKLDKDIADARSKKSTALAKGPADGKGAVFERLLRFANAGGEWVAYAQCLLVVVMLQMAQTILPVVGKSAYATSPALPPPLPETPPIALTSAQTVPVQVTQPALPPPLPATAPPVLQTPSPQPPAPPPPAPAPAPKTKTVLGKKPAPKPQTQPAGPRLVAGGGLRSRIS